MFEIKPLLLVVVLALFAMPSNAGDSETLFFNRIVLICDEYGCREFVADSNNELSSDSEPMVEDIPRNAEPNLRIIEEPIEPEIDDENSASHSIFNDLGAQWVMAIGTLGILVFTGLGLRYIAKTLGEAKKTTKAANKTIEETRRIGEAQVRAYLSVRSMNIQDGEFSEFEVEVENAGQSPAANVELDFRIRLIRKTEGSSDEEIVPGLSDTDMLRPVPSRRVEKFKLGKFNYLGKLDVRSLEQDRYDIEVVGTLRWRDVFEGRWDEPFAFCASDVCEANFFEKDSGGSEGGVLYRLRRRKHVEMHPTSLFEYVTGNISS